MSDDSFIREVNEELRQDQLHGLWKRYGAWAIAAVVAMIMAAAAWQGYTYWVDSRASASGDRFLHALNLANEGKSDQALTELQALEADGYGAYPVLARMRQATLLLQQGETDTAVRTLDSVAADASVPEAIRDMARLRAAIIMVDHGSYEDVASRAEQLAVDSSTLRHSAREALGLAAWKAGRSTDALQLFEQVVADDEAPRNVRQRAQLMVELIRGAGDA